MRPLRVAPVDFRTVRQDAALTYERVAELLDVTVRTVHNWEKGRCRIPYAAYELLRLKTGSALPYPGFQGWECHHGVLISPAGDVFTPAELTWLTLTFEMAREWQRSQGLRPSFPPAEQALARSAVAADPRPLQPAQAAPGSAPEVSLQDPRDAVPGAPQTVLQRLLYRFAGGPRPAGAPPVRRAGTNRLVTLRRSVQTVHLALKPPV